MLKGEIKFRNNLTKKDREEWMKSGEVRTQIQAKGRDALALAIRYATGETIPGTGGLKIETRTSELSSSIVLSGVFYPSKGYPAINLRATARHATYVHDGTVPHVISVKKAKKLYFWWEREGVYFKGLIVNHPGTAPRPFLAEAVKETFKRSTVRVT